MKYLIWIALLPSIMIVFLIYHADKIEKEPKLELLKFFLLGFIATVITLLLSSFIQKFNLEINFQNPIHLIFYSFAVVGFIEEFSKWILSFLFLRKNKNFNYLLDGIVYVTFLSLGFATIENILYTFVGGIETGVFRAFTTVPAHTFFGISCGYYFSLAKEEKIKKRKQTSFGYLFLSLFVPSFLHGFYDFCLLTKNAIFLFLFGVFVLMLYSISIFRIKKLMKIDHPFTEE